MSVAQLIDHTILRSDATSADVEKLCQEVVEHGFCTACVHPEWIQVAKQFPVKVATTVAFPYGMTLGHAKAHEATLAVRAGADEIDMVALIGRIKEGRFDLVEEDIRLVVQAVPGTLVKVIIEAGLLTHDEIVSACNCIEQAGAHFAKSSTGILSTGASVEAVRLMRSSLSKNVGVKASGGIRTLEALNELVAAGANRIGTSAGIKILAEAQALSPQ